MFTFEFGRNLILSVMDEQIEMTYLPVFLPEMPVFPFFEIRFSR